MKRLKKSILSKFILFIFNNNAYAVSNSKTNQFELCLSSVNVEADNCFRSASMQIKNYSNCLALKKQVKSDLSKEKIHSYCFSNFFERGHFKSLNSCINATSGFISYDLHDHAVLECLINFQSSITYDECKLISKSMRHTSKRDYVLNYCEAKNE